MKPIRFGILGAARIAANQLIPAMRDTPGVEVTALASRDEARGLAFAKRFDIPNVYSSYEALLRDPHIDAVYIPLPNHLHAPMTLLAAAHGKHVLCEKPAARSATEAVQMIAACREHGVIFREAFMYPHHHQWKRVHEIVASGEIGTIRAVHAAFSFPLNRDVDIRLNSEMGGGALYDVGCYAVHAVRTFLGKEEPESVTASGFFYEDGVVDQTIVAILQFSGGRFGYLDCSFSFADRQRVEIIGDQGSIVVRYPFRPDKGSPDLRIDTPHAQRVETLAHDAMYRAMVESFADAIRTGRSLTEEEEGTIQNMMWMDLIYDAAGRKMKE
ncbi:Gfo/Idh/MocA family protein [Ferroacidibacillus organovorans]|uniref:Oxidoreductase n=1 Tax=Ferroacidibacillus organovorans TaxID=1765683 RepID=A0A853KFK6_9BACL|nr:Gfo/Idh/MocA family oxidoreductase [Ferroacidibacillus organovorans]KYP81394.1 hypothetical protein AYJ22_01115 [Ferroacidibacillus organovorans]OAG95181.1 hypothetical protein AYW79_01715 [Ferroacidibacillus organovorans]